MNLEQIVSWWRARTSRERLMVQLLGGIFAVALPLSAYQGAAGVRDRAAAALREAREVSAGVETLRQLGPAPAGVSNEASLRSVALASAESLGLKASRVEPAGAGRLKIAFEAADSRIIYRWMDAMGKRGAFIVQTSIVRDGDKDLVLAQFEIGASPL